MHPAPCPGCGFAVGSADSICPQCGRSVQPAASEAPAPSTNAASAPGVTATKQPLPSYADPAYYESLARSGTRSPTDLPAGPLPGLPATRARRPSRGFGWLRQLVAPLILLGLIGVALLYTGPGLLARVQSIGSPLSAPIPTATVPTTASGEVILYTDPLNTGTTGWEHQDGCTFRTDGLHVTDGFDCFAPLHTPGESATDVHIVVTLKQVAGPLDHWNGVAFRASYSSNAYLQAYLFGVTGDGHWGMLKCADGSRICTPLVFKEGNGVVHAGLNAANTLDVVARGTQIDFTINSAHVGTFDDSTYSGGMVAMSGDEGSETVYSNLTVSRPLA